MSQLADKIAAEISPLQPLALETKNISDLDSAEAANIHAALEAELKNRSFRLLPADSAATAAQLQLTISQGAQGYVLVAAIQNDADLQSGPQVAIVAAPQAEPGMDQQPDSALSLDKRLIYQQPAQFLDFALLSPDADGNPTLLAVIEPDRLAYYRAQQGSWRFIQAIPIAPWRVRDRRGHIDNDRTHVYVGDVTCTGELAQPDTLKCEQTGSGVNSSPVFTTGDQAGVGSPCKNQEAYLQTGTGDWTQMDSIQGYQFTDGRVSASGAPIEVPGPVMSFWQEPGSSAARAVVYNLKTKIYEGYLVTATCAH